MKELGRWGSPLVLYIIISGQLHCHSRPLEHPFWMASAPMYHSTSDIASVLQTAQLFFPPKFLLQFKRVNKMPRQQGQPLQEALYWFQNLVISATKENQRENKSHIHFIKPKKPKHDPFLEKTSVYSTLPESASKTKIQNKSEYILYSPGQDYRCSQNKTLTFLFLGFVFLSFHFLSSCFPETESIFLSQLELKQVLWSEKNQQ